MATLLNEKPIYIKTNHRSWWRAWITCSAPPRKPWSPRCLGSPSTCRDQAVSEERKAHDEEWLFIYHLRLHCSHPRSRHLSWVRDICRPAFLLIRSGELSAKIEKCRGDSSTYVVLMSQQQFTSPSGTSMTKRSYVWFSAEKNNGNETH